MCALPAIAGPRETRKAKLNQYPRNTIFWARGSFPAAGEQVFAERTFGLEIVAKQTNVCYTILMRKNKNKRTAWNAIDRQAYADGLRTRAVTIHHKRKPAPTVREWQ